VPYSSAILPTPKIGKCHEKPGTFTLGAPVFPFFTSVPVEINDYTHFGFDSGDRFRKGCLYSRPDPATGKWRGVVCVIQNTLCERALRFANVL
jgi:hypothetical protein